MGRNSNANHIHFFNSVPTVNQDFCFRYSSFSNVCYIQAKDAEKTLLGISRHQWKGRFMVLGSFATLEIRAHTQMQRRRLHRPSSGKECIASFLSFSQLQHSNQVGLSRFPWAFVWSCHNARILAMIGTRKGDNDWSKPIRKER